MAIGLWGDLRSWRILKVLPGEQRSERRLVESAVRQNGLALQWASEALRADRDVVLLAVRCTWQAARFALGAAREHRDVLLAAGRWPRSRSPRCSR